MAERTITEQIIREDPAIEALKFALMEKARDAVGTPVTIPAYQVAGQTADQLEAERLGRLGIGSFAPFIQSGSDAISAGQDFGQTAADYLTSADTRGQFLPAQQTLEAGVATASGIGQLAGQAGIGLGTMSAGTGRVGLAGQLAGRFLGADLAPSQSMFADAARASGGATFGYNPALVESFMNPYQQQVTLNALGEMRRQADIARQGQAAQAIRSGAFGGTREGVQRAETERGVQDIMSQRILQDFAQNYGQAQQAAQQSFEAQQQRQMAAAGQFAGIGDILGKQQLAQTQIGQAGTGLIGQLGAQQAQLGLLPSQLSSTQANILAQQAGLFGQLGQGIGSLAGQQFGIGQNISSGLGALGSQAGQLGVQQAALGEALQRAQVQDIQTMSALGQQKQSQQQAELEAKRMTELQKEYEPYQRFGFLSDIYKGAPTTQSVLASQTSPSASPLAQVVGAAGAALTGGGAARKLGIL